MNKNLPALPSETEGVISRMKSIYVAYDGFGEEVKGLSSDAHTIEIYFRRFGILESVGSEVKTWQQRLSECDDPTGYGDGLEQVMQEEIAELRAALAAHQQQEKASAPVSAPEAQQEPVASIPPEPSADLVASLQRAVDSLDQWRLCMSYNDSYFGEPAGLVKRTTKELKHLLDRYVAQPEWIDGRNDDPAEAAFWRFDARHKGYGRWKLAPQSERDAFKAEYRAAVATPQSAQAAQDAVDAARYRFVRDCKNSSIIFSSIHAGECGRNFDVMIDQHLAMRSNTDKGE